MFDGEVLFPTGRGRTVRYPARIEAEDGGIVCAFEDPPFEKDAYLLAAARDLYTACKEAEKLIEAYADGIDERCGDSGCMCTMPGNTPHSQSIRDNELAQVRAAIAKAELLR